MTRQPAATVRGGVTDNTNMKKHTTEANWYCCSCAPTIPGVPVVSDEQVFVRTVPPGLPARGTRHQHDITPEYTDWKATSYGDQEEPYTSDESNNASEEAFRKRRSRDRCTKCHRRRCSLPKRLYACPACTKAYSQLYELQRHRMGSRGNR